MFKSEIEIISKHQLNDEFRLGIWYNMVWYDGMVSKYGIKSHTILHTIPSYHTKIIINPYLELISCILPAFTKPLNQEIIIRNERTTLSVS